MALPCKITSREQLIAQLQALSARFEAMEPELELSLRDADCELEGYVVVWNTAISRHGPLANCGKGGTRIRRGLSLAEVKMLAKKMALKNAAAGLPLGGAKSGINADPNAAGFEHKYRRFVGMCQPFTHENGGTFGGFGYDIGAAPEHALWACDTLQSTRSFTGKTQAMGGTDYDREGIAGLGVAQAAARLIELNQEDPTRTQFSVHGVGAMGAAVIRYFSEHGARLAGLGDPKFGCSWRFAEPPSSALISALCGMELEVSKRLLEREGRRIDKDPNAILFAETDVLFPCAMHNAITEHNAERVQSRYIVEGANNPCSAAAYDILHAAGIHHIPDFMANSGGIIAAFIELSSDISDAENARSGAKIAAAKSSTRRIISDNIDQVFELSQRFHLPIRDVGMHRALQAIFSLPGDHADKADAVGAVLMSSLEQKREE